jgi:hypothetical protein
MSVYVCERVSFLMCVSVYVCGCIPWASSSRTRVCRWTGGRRWSETGAPQHGAYRPILINLFKSANRIQRKSAGAKAGKGEKGSDDVRRNDVKNGTFERRRGRKGRAQGPGYEGRGSSRG